MTVHDGIPQVALEDQPAPACCHYWIIETANGPISRGECEICHEVRDFRNSVFDMDRSTQDTRYRKRPAVEENDQQAVALQVSEELDQDQDGDEPDPGEPDIEEMGFAEPENEEPEFARVLVD